MGEGHPAKVSAQQEIIIHSDLVIRIVVPNPVVNISPDNTSRMLGRHSEERLEMALGIV